MTLICRKAFHLIRSVAKTERLLLSSGRRYIRLPYWAHAKCSIVEEGSAILPDKTTSRRMAGVTLLPMGASMKGKIRVGIGGWTYEPWRGVFYPAHLPQKRELEFASRAVNTIEINGTFHSTFKPDSWRKWRDETPDGFVFGIKGSRFCTNRQVLASVGAGIDVFMAQGITELGEKLGPINWQLAETKPFDPDDVKAFLALLPDEAGGLSLRHAIEVSHPSFNTPAFFDMAAIHGVAVIRGDSDAHTMIDSAAGFTYARFKTSSEEWDDGFSNSKMDGFARQAREWSDRGDVFAYFISGAKDRNPAAAQTLLRKLE